MAIVRVEAIRKEFGAHTLFSDISFEIGPTDRIGLIGVNGSGKTTLMRMLLGLEGADEGAISVSSGITLAYVEQHANWNSTETLFEYVLGAFSPLLAMERQLLALESSQTDNLGKWDRHASLSLQYEQAGGLTFRSETRSALLGLGFDEEAQRRCISAFSGGQISKAALCKAILTKADLLLLDEPTNHLDIPSVRWLESYLLQYKGASFLVSHDRAFLDHVTTRMIELENGHILCHKGNYSRHLELKMDERELATKRYQSARKEIRRIEGIIDQQRRWNQKRNFITIASKEKQIDRIRQGMVAPERDPRELRFHFPVPKPTGNDVLMTNELCMQYGTVPVFSHVNLDIKAGQCVCLIGENGCGKTTLLKILCGRLSPSNGTFRIGAGVKIGYYEQNVSFDDSASTVLQTLSDAFPRMDVPTLRGHLGTFLFRGDDIDKTVKMLSGGEKARLQLLMLILNGCNVLLLDEPTNHLDISSAEMLEKALERFEGTSLIVTHDRYLVERLADRVLLMHTDGITEQQDEADDLFALVKSPKPAVLADAKTDADNYYKLQKEHKQAIAHMRQELQQTERDIASNEAETDSLNRRITDTLGSGEFCGLEPMYDRLNVLAAQNASLYELWQSTYEKLQATEGEETT